MPEPMLEPMLELVESKGGEEYLPKQRWADPSFRQPIGVACYE